MGVVYLRIAESVLNNSAQTDFYPMLSGRLIRTSEKEPKIKT